jgi:hypothetical protein
MSMKEHETNGFPRLETGDPNAGWGRLCSCLFVHASCLMFNVLAYVGLGFFGRNGRLSNIGWGSSPCVTRGLFNCGPGLCSAVVRGLGNATHGWSMASHLTLWR